MSHVRSFAGDTWFYIRRVEQFKKMDWLVYFMWVGQIFSLAFVILTLMVVGHRGGVTYPAYAWNVPIGTFIFAMAEYDWLFSHLRRADNEFDNGQFIYSIGIGFNF